MKQSQGYDGRQTDIYEGPVAMYYIDILIFHIGV